MVSNVAKCVVDSLLRDIMYNKLSFRLKIILFGAGFLQELTIVRQDLE